MFPREQVLTSSVFYPASGFHGDVIKKLASYFHSFIYVDYSKDKESFDTAIDKISGYSVAGYKKLNISELSSTSPPPTLHSRFQREMKRAPVKPIFKAKSPFASWVVMERNQTVGEEHGPERFSLVFICADGAAAYHAMYASDKIAPKALAIIQPGHAFGGNYTNFTSRDALLAHIVLDMEGPAPEFYSAVG